MSQHDVLVPYAGDCLYRERAWEWVRAQYEKHHPDWQIIEGHCDGEWCKATAVADALRQSTAPLLIVADADVWSDTLAETVGQVRTWGRPHRKVIRFNPKATDLICAGAQPNDLAQPHSKMVTEQHQAMLGGGIIVCTRDTYDECPLDPRFVGWGGDDQAWGFALRALAGEPHAGQGKLWHLWHPPQKRRSRTRGSLENQRLVGRYEIARHDPDAMRALIEEGRQWASTRSS